MMETYQKLQKKMYDQNYKRHGRDIPKLNNYNTDELAKALSQQQSPAVGSYNPPLLSPSQQRHLPTLDYNKQSKISVRNGDFAAQNQRISKILSQRQLKIDSQSILSSLLPSPSHGGLPDLKKLSSEDLLELTSQKMVQDSISTQKAQKPRG